MADDTTDDNKFPNNGNTIIANLRQKTGRLEYSLVITNETNYVGVTWM
jgi:hypothetical protein